MYCRYCGQEIVNGARFCENCGKATEQSEKERKKKRGSAGFAVMAAAITLVIVLILQNFSILPLLSNIGRNSSRSENLEETGHETPEETAEAFARAISENDLDRAVSFFGSRHMSENYDIYKSISRMMSWSPTLSCKYPSDNGIFQKVNEEQLRSDASEQIGWMCFSLQAEEDYLAQSVISCADRTPDEIANDLEVACLLDDLDTFSFVRMDEWGDSETWKSFSDSYGAEEMREYTVLYEYSGETYWGGMRLISYDGEWYICGLNAVMAGQEAMGYLTRIDEANYVEMVE